MNAPASSASPPRPSCRLFPPGSCRSRRRAPLSWPRSAARPSSRCVYLSDALGRVLAEPVTSTTDLPPWDNSAMDGYAVRAADTAGATEDGPVRLEVVGEVRAGQAPEVEVPRGGAVRIATGAPVPPRADAVVPVELTTPLDATGAPAGPRGRDATGPVPAAILVHATVEKGGSIRRAGSDLARGATILETGTVVTAAGDRPGGRRRRPAAVGTPATPGPRPRDRRRGEAGRTGAGSGGHPRRQRPRHLGARRCSRRPVLRPRDRQGPDRGRRFAAVRRSHRRRRCDRRVGWGVGRAVRRRQARVREDRPDRSLAGRRAAGQAVRFRHRGPAGWRPDAPVRPSRQPGLELRDIRVVRPSRHSRTRRPPAPIASCGRSIGPSSTRLSRRVTADGPSSA